MDPEQIRRLREVADELREVVEQLEGGWKVEITEGQISVVMVDRTLPRGLNVRHLRRQVEAQTPDVIVLSDTDVEDPVTGLRKIPDLMVLAADGIDLAARKVNSRDLLLVVEVVSGSNPNNDYREKLDDYPRMGIPTYLVVDPRKATLSVYGDPVRSPEGTRYATARTHAFGDAVHVDRWVFETAGLTRYPDSW
ncbi:Uma2 family endonuclease [Kitasatospora sp. NPDC094015]|uniref:Uma2 family endonuclease n=1 Tax=Kitasatospora sp. NPDC094015 TaxID=3155205 RepID=UPI00331D48B8